MTHLLARRHDPGPPAKRNLTIGRPTFLRGVSALLGALAAFAPAFAPAEVLSVPELAAKVQQWETGKKIPPPVQYQVEGRGTLLNRRRVQFRNCRIQFEAVNDLAAPSRRNSNIEVTGTVVRDEETKAYAFRVESLRELPNDLETFLERRRELRNQSADAWYKLGDWARQRGEFYKDQELLARAQEADLRGLELEWQGPARGDPPKLLALAEKTRRLGLPETLSQELRHEALVDLWQKTRGESGQALADLLKQMAELLPDSTVPLSDPHEQLQKDYFASPLVVYRSADGPGRKTLHRLLYLDVLLRTITADLAADGSNGFAIAGKIDTLAPEQHAFAETCRDRALAARSREVETLTRTDMLALAEEYRGRQQPQRAEQLIESWLTLRQRRLESDDIEGLIQLTDEYRSLLKHNDIADRLLKEAWKKNPRATEISGRLQRAGYRLYEGAWLSAAEYNRRPEGHLDQAIRAGRVEIGMSAGNLRQSLGAPQRLARSATSGQITEIWTYDQVGSTRLTVRLQRNRRQTEATVTEVSQAAGE
jgi:hypothetical protein